MHPPTEDVSSWARIRERRRKADRAEPAAFVAATHAMVNDPETDHVIRWNEAGTAMVIVDPSALRRTLLPLYFDHANYASFTRQLNNYGFAKINPSHLHLYAHPLFHRDAPEDMVHICRKSSSRKLVPAVAKPDEAAAALAADTAALATRIDGFKAAQAMLAVKLDAARAANAAAAAELASGRVRQAHLNGTLHALSMLFAADPPPTHSASRDLRRSRSRSPPASPPTAKRQRGLALSPTVSPTIDHHTTLLVMSDATFWDDFPQLDTRPQDRRP